MARERTPDWPHPRARASLVGHGEAVAGLLAAAGGGRLHHAWLLGGPRGIGKATLAYRLARFLLAGRGPSGLALGEDDPLFRRVAAAGHPDLLTIERAVSATTGKLKDEIGVDQARELSDFFALTPLESGYRVAIVDSADEMTRSAANAMLKILEEPPNKAVLILVAHAPGRLLPTIRSRCRRLALRPLEPLDVTRVVTELQPDLGAAEAVGLVGLAEGSPGRALALAAAGGLDHWREIGALLEPLGRGRPLDIKAAHGLADRVTGRDQGDLFRLTMDLLGLWLARMIRLAAGTAGPGDAGQAAMLQLAGRARLERWSEVWEKVNALVARAEAVNLDRRHVLMAALSMIERAARSA